MFSTCTLHAVTVVIRFILILLFSNRMDSGRFESVSKVKHELIAPENRLLSKDLDNPALCLPSSFALLIYTTSAGYERPSAGTRDRTRPRH
jgi:hypothetical protein